MIKILRILNKANSVDSVSDAKSKEDKRDNFENKENALVGKKKDNISLNKEEDYMDEIEQLENLQLL